MHADFDNDGDLDILVLRGGWLHADGRIRNSLLRNDTGSSAGQFVDVTRGAGMAAVSYPTQTAGWADYDNDGDLDVYVGNEGDGIDAFPSQLFRNNGNGTFTDVAESAGVVSDRYTKGVSWGDYNNDGHADLYVSTNNSANRLYRNDGEGKFTDVAPELGVVEPGHRSFAT
ncbi:MAG: VCBS repeat-containing protein [Gammaproteobacteria bacterium]|nr:VCBS repeat-containing protein [Gammaproteobacteria bacterium]